MVGHACKFARKKRGLLVLTGLMAGAFAASSLSASGEDSWQGLLERAESLVRLDVQRAAPLVDRLEQRMMVAPTDQRRLDFLRVAMPGQVVQRGLATLEQELAKQGAEWSHDGELALQAGIYELLARLHWRFGDLESAQSWLEEAVVCSKDEELPVKLRFRLLETAVQLALGKGQAGVALDLLGVAESGNFDEWSTLGTRMDLLRAHALGSLRGDAGALRLMGEALERVAERMDATTPLDLRHAYWVQRIRLSLRLGREEQAAQFLKALGEALRDGELRESDPVYAGWRLYLHGDRNADKLAELKEMFLQAGCPACFELMRADWFRLALEEEPGSVERAVGVGGLSRGPHAFPVIQMLGNEWSARQAAARGDPERAYRLLEAARKSEQSMAAGLRSSREWREDLETRIAGHGDRRTGLADSREGLVFYGLIAFLLLVALGLAILLRTRTRSELTRHLEDLLEKARRAERMSEQANRYKSQFLANVSHEIRTPMNGIIGMASLMDELVTDDRQRQCLETIQICSQNLLVLLNDLVDLSRIENGTLELERIPFDAGEMLEQCERLSADRFEQTGHALQIIHESSLPHCVVGDAVHIGQIVLKLLYHAIDRSEGTRVELRAGFERTMGSSGNLMINVRYSADHYTEEQLDLLFEPFGGGDLRQGHTEGSGLALPLSRRLAESMGGKLRVVGKDNAGQLTLQLELPVQETREEPEFLRNRFNTFAMGRQIKQPLVR